MPQCALCPNQIKPDDLDVLQEELVWKGAEYRQHTGRVAHRDCVDRLSDRVVTPDQESLF